MNVSSESAGFGGYGMLLLGLALAASLLVGLYQPSKPLVWQANEVRVIDGDEPAYAAAGFDDRAWQTTVVQQLDRTPGVTWLRVEIEFQSRTGLAPPYALLLSGPYSAEAWWDGQRLGAKGVVGANLDTESPGPIDSVLYIPEALAAGQRHVLALRMSAHHVGYHAEALIHGIAVGAYDGDPRRELRYYALPMFLSGGLLLLVLQFARMWHASGSIAALALAAMAVSLCGQLASEVMRSLVAYSYDWHLWRSLAVWFFAVLAGVALNVVVYRRTATRSRWWPAAIAVAVPVSSYLTSGFDDKTVVAIGILSVLPLIAGVNCVVRRKSDRVLIAAGLLGLSWLIAGMISSLNLLDTSIYLTSLAFLVSVWMWSARGEVPLADSAPDDDRPDHFYVRHTGREERIAASRVLYLKATGNYAEMVLADGRKVLHHQRLGQIMESPPRGFVRVHRSYAINLAYTTGIRSLEGSRYLAELVGDIEVPVSRYQVGELREALAGRVP